MREKLFTKIWAICEDRWQPSLFGDESLPFKICHNCRFIGPDKPGVYNIPEGTYRPFYAHNREYIVVTEEEMGRLYQEFFDQVAEINKISNENKL